MEKETLLTQVWEISTTVASEEMAKSIAMSLLDRRLAGCVQIVGPIRSLYRWKDAVQDDLEWKLAIKTSQPGLEACWNEVRRLHPYETPELLARPFTMVATDYQRWIQEQVSLPDISRLRPRWHLRLARCGPDAIAGPETSILGKRIPSLQLPTGPIPLTVSFEQVEIQLSSLATVHFEPDGSFIWTATGSPRDPHRVWQLEGMVYDRANRIEYVELKGNCDRKTWEWLVQVLSGIECAQLAVQWIDQGTWISEADFRKCVD